MGTSMISMVTCDVCTKNNNNDQNENTPITKIPLYDGAKETYEALKENTPLPKNLIDLKIQTKDLIYVIMPILFSLFHYDLKKYNRNYNKSEIQLRSRKSFFKSLEVGELFC